MMITYCFHYLELLEQPVCSGAGICNSLLPSLTDIDSNVCDWSVASNFFLDSLIIIVNQSCCLESVSSLITRQASCVSIMPWLQTFYWFRLRFPASVFFNKFSNWSTVYRSDIQKWFWYFLCFSHQIPWIYMCVFCEILKIIVTMNNTFFIFL